jgi:hypothetical protein
LTPVFFYVIDSRARRWYLQGHWTAAISAAVLDLLRLGPVGRRTREVLARLVRPARSVARPRPGELARPGSSDRAGPSNQPGEIARPLDRTEPVEIAESAGAEVAALNQAADVHSPID